MSESLSDLVRDEVALRLASRTVLADVQGELIESSSGYLSEGAPAALWPFAWSSRPSGMHHLDHVRRFRGLTWAVRQKGWSASSSPEGEPGETVGPIVGPVRVAS